MSVYLSKFLWPLLNPANLLLTLLILGGLLQIWRPWRRWVRRGVFVLLLALLSVSVLPLGRLLVEPLEGYFPPPQLPEKLDGIILLSGSEQPVLTAAWGQPQVNAAAERYLVFTELARRYPDAKLLYTGAGLQLGVEPGLLMAEADVAERIFQQIGIPLDRVMFERAARNTIENAVNSKAVAKPQPGETWALVTSARHMPRAVNCFRAVDWQVLPVPVDYISTPRQPGWGGFASLGFNPMAGLTGLNLATQEWLGLFAYRLLGHTRTILPERLPDRAVK
ncbi:YdcF family protein [Ferrovibrio sp.]|uniref:YdcF family protein n=1 Tax=Ferrovibrio sp. TaxID=1917215 RepID=UPI0025C337A0|nr:YdcF family protein [Ferrovibrio sp.]MBX3455900.1 YdcF family protein [Ferrovibrio sp.]